MIIVKTREEIELMRESALIVSKTLGEVAKAIKPGVTTLQLDKIAETYIRDHGAIPGFLGLYNFPNTLCMSPNTQVVHGIPNNTSLVVGVIIFIDWYLIHQTHHIESLSHSISISSSRSAQIMKNEEIMNLVEIMGLKFGTTYDESNIKTLRYGHLMIMADQDHDGSHIKGLVINFMHHFWPCLLDVPGFLQQFITPIVKVTKGKKTETFFTLPEYEEWKESTGNDAKGWTIKCK